MATMNATRWSPLSRLAGEAAVSESELRFANGSTPSTDSQGTSQVIYGLAQCTRDLNASECMRCLTTLMAGLSSSSPSNTYGTAATAVPATPVDDSPTKMFVFHVKDQSPQPGLERDQVLGVTAGSVAFVMCTGILVWFLLHRRSIKAREHKLDVFDRDPLQDESFEEGTGPRRFRCPPLPPRLKRLIRFISFCS
ncbi:uncharacterized protein [Setaria viridis]|uniref:Gnk2-homologous domain-containing protein n=1 Tax=Setaria viridis TaxID=4556 RepID=A0A4U6VFX4_SETVI|nr:uncharacterized protein LOC117847746 isoform X1 [Setaria viridis]TKW28471.1 hypothetical protein SEVIR_3G325400v2 [Setaria viridis]